MLNIERNSILFKISLAFLLIIFLSSVFFFFLYQNAKERELRDFIKNAVLLVTSGRSEIPKSIESNYEIIEDPEFIYNVYTNGKVELERDFLTIKIYLIEYEHQHYVLVNQFGINFLVKKKNEFSLHRLVILSWIMFNVIIVGIYIGIVKSFYPLKVLREKIKALKSGSFDVKIDVEKNDEIGFIAKEFNEAITTLKKNEEIRRWFLRNIAHELKTPITKGKIAIELLEDEKGKQHFEKIFNRLEFLVNQLMTVEKIVSKDIKLKFECLEVKKVIDNAISLLLATEKPNINIVLNEELKIKVDLNIFSIAVKNLLDNGLKFSEDGKVDVIVKDKKIYFINKGDKPPFNEELLFEPFIKETSLKNQEGLGLGLYITKFIADFHNVKIEYQYQEGKNVFILDLSQVIC
ncbi:ArsS family sensor histidine kinase [Sulfurihydrogenibium sp.]|uniref:ArsS family sensor histidine kinase n=1 Tax=Sulfurihydrogenibium sp. TaxID=2053621 RepID=UPI003D0C3AE5